jgi:hypothetical protein
VIGLSLIFSAESLSMQNDAFVISTDSDVKGFDLNQSNAPVFSSENPDFSPQKQTQNVFGISPIYDELELRLFYYKPIENQFHESPFQDRKSTFFFYLPQLSCF